MKGDRQPLLERVRWRFPHQVGFDLVRVPGRCNVVLMTSASWFRYARPPVFIAKSGGCPVDNPRNTSANLCVSGGLWIVSGPVDNCPEPRHMQSRSEDLIVYAHMTPLVLM